MHCLDANIFLEVQLAQAKASECEELLEAVRKGTAEAVVSDFSIYTVALVMENNAKSPDEIKNFFASLFAYDGLRIHQLSNEDRVAATLLMQKHRLSLDDALVLQCAVASKASSLVSLDRHFDKVNEIKRLTPGQALARD
ncbi:MAG: type II toxin-antitoxin system VapC family toxin [Candidatus Micrarchaeota archaeon]